MVTDIQIKFEKGFPQMKIKIVIDFSKEIMNRTMFMFLEKTDRRDLLPSLEMFGPVLFGRIDSEDKDNIIFDKGPKHGWGMQDVFNECLSETVERICDIICFTDKTIKLDGSDIYFHDGLKFCGANSNMIISVDGKEMRYNPY